MENVCLIMDEAIRNFNWVIFKIFQKLLHQFLKSVVVSSANKGNEMH